MNKLRKMLTEAEHAMAVNNAKVVHVVVKKGRKILREFDLLQEQHKYKSTFVTQSGHHG
jgi:hypothetical protein